MDRTNPTQLPRVQALHAVLSKLKPGDQTFAQSLLNSYRQWGKLSDKQMEWVDKLTARATAPPQAARDDEVKYGQKIPGFTVVEDLLYRAAQHQQFPCIRLKTEKGQSIKLSPRKHSRQVKVTVSGGHGEAWGDVSNEVLDLKSLRFLADLPDVLNTLYQMAAHPVETAILYGKKYKSCCFCGISLTDPRSLLQGYGPICAENYGLPWGEEPERVSVDELEQLWKARE